MGKTFALKGHICYSKDIRHIETVENGWIVCEDGLVSGVYESLPERFNGVETVDCTDKLIIPGLIDLHVHAPQYPFRTLGMDLELIDWLNTHTFPEEAKYADLEYAKAAYTIFAQDLKKSATTRAAIFATIHGPATELLMDLLEASGMKAFVGKVNMDRNSPPYLCEESAEISAQNTISWLEKVSGKYNNIKPILTPRFIPSCSDGLMEKLSGIRKQYDLPVQSHLSENLGEIAWVKELCPDTGCYGEAYARFDLFGGGCPTIMAHCVHPSEEEMELMTERKVFVAHCPQSNTNLSSGIAPVRAYLDREIPVGLGSDVAGGYTLSILRAMADAISVSKLRWRLQDERLKPLTVEEAFYLGTKGGGAFFGNTGGFEAGSEFDAVILDDAHLKHPQPLTVRQRLERMIYLSDERDVAGKYVAGQRVI